jgi:hypothetical protein
MNAYTRLNLASRLSFTEAGNFYPNDETIQYTNKKRSKKMLKRLSALAIVAFLVTLAAGSPAQATKTVTFQVHMGAMIQSGAFNPAVDSVVIRGTFQTLAGDAANWSGQKFVMAPTVANDSIYALAVAFPDTAAGDTIQYKYVIYTSTASDNWESTNNRTYIITSTAAQQIPLAYFNNQLPGVVATVNITFVVDATNLLAEGFNPAKDSIYVVGGNAPLNWGWAAGEVMTASFDNPSLYETTLKFTGVVGATVNFKLFGAGADPFSNGGWESGSNHTMSFPAKDTTVTWVPDLHVTKPSAVADTVVFHVDLNKAYDGINYKPITKVKEVWMTGSVKPLNWPPTGWPLADTLNSDSTGTIDTTGQLHKMYDNGTHGDSVAGDNKWTLTLVFKPGVSSYVEYKYGAVFSGYDTLTVDGTVSNGSLIDNESATGVNHSWVLSGSKQLVYNHFGDMDPNNPGTAVRLAHDGIPSNFELSQNYPNPFNPTTQINYSVTKSGYVTLKVYNVLGQEVTTLVAGSQRAGSYVATFDGNKFASGVYFYRLQAGTFSSVKKMVLMK